MAKGKLIVLEAGDGSGKATQAKLLYDTMKKANYPVHLISYPDYDSESSALGRMYLRGDFGHKPEDVNAYEAATFFAVDRLAAYRTKWKKWYDAGDIIIADRYVASNAVHQYVKIPDERKQDDFIVWLWDLELVKFGLPMSDLTVFLDMEPEAAARLIQRRARMEDKEEDIHEVDRKYLEQVHAAYSDFAQRYGWKRVPCSEDGQVRDPAAIHADVLECVQQALKR